MSKVMKCLGFCMMIVGSLALVYCMVNLILLAQSTGN